MLFAAYLVLVVSVLVWVREVDVRRWPVRAARWTLLFARASAFAVALILATVGVLLGGSGDFTGFGRVASITLIVGGALLLAGIVAWRGPLAQALRVGGWLLAVVVLSVPSTLTLFLLVTAPVLFLLGPARVSQPESESPAETLG